MNEELVILQQMLANLKLEDCQNITVIGVTFDKCYLIKRLSSVIANMEIRMALYEQCYKTKCNEETFEKEYYCKWIGDNDE